MHTCILLPKTIDSVRYQHQEKFSFFSGFWKSCQQYVCYSAVGTYNRVFWVNFQDFSERCMCFSIVVLTEVDKGPGKQTHTHIS